MIALTALITLVGCDKKVPDSTAAAQPANSVMEEPQWRETKQGDLSDEQLEALQRAESARATLGSRLIGMLSETIATQGIAAAVPVCSQAAPRMAEEASREFGVSVGRTAARLRNPDNTAPAWAATYVENGQKTPIILTGPGGTVATLHPIPTGALCTKCHGPTDTLDADVLTAIQAAYPLDTATGFNEGDLRGWFWAEAPLLAAAP